MTVSFINKWGIKSSNIRYFKIKLNVAVVINNYCIHHIRLLSLLQEFVIYYLLVYNLCSIKNWSVSLLPRTFE